MTICGDAVATGPEIVVGTWLVNCRGVDDVIRRMFVTQIMQKPDAIKIGGIGAGAGQRRNTVLTDHRACRWVAVGSIRVSPADVYRIKVVNSMRDCEPVAVARA